MTKSTITRTWIGGLAVFAAGIILAIVGAILMAAYGGTFTQVPGADNYEFTPTVNGFFWTTVTLIVAGGVVALAGSLVQLVAWIGALINSYALTERSWFAVLLIGGLIGFGFAPIGFAVMVAYVVAAPEAPLHRPAQLPTAGPLAAPLAPTA